MFPSIRHPPLDNAHHTFMQRLFRISCLLIALLPIIPAGIAVFSQTSREFFSDSFQPGREYFILRSGNAKLILQSDKSGTGPAFTYLLFDADKPCQTLRKERAFNFTAPGLCRESALEVLLGGVPFTALPHLTHFHWGSQDGIPTAVATWWAGGIKVQESFTALSDANTFIRRVVLSGENLAGPDSVQLRLRLPPGHFFKHKNSLVGIVHTICIGLAFGDAGPAIVNTVEGSITSAPISISPGQRVAVTSFITATIPAEGFPVEPSCDSDQPIQAEYLRPSNGDKTSHGLTAEYFSNPDLRGAPVLGRVDTNLSPYWDTAAPAPHVPPDSFSVRWTGRILAPRSGAYRFSLVADDRARLFIDDTLLIDCWRGSWNISKSAEIRFVAGTVHPIRIEFAELAGWAGMRLRWSLPVSSPDEGEMRAGVAKDLAGLERLAQSDTSRATAGTRAYWERTNSLTTDDSLVCQLYAVARNALPGMVGRSGAMDAGIFEYGAQWVRDGSNVALGLIQAGHFESARALLGFILSDLVSAGGTTVVSGGIDQPDREELDQMGELIHALKAYRDWTGDTTLIVASRKKIVAMVERPLGPEFRDSTGMVHNRREYWERTFDDAYELAYQTFMVVGLREAADLSGLLAVPEKGKIWRHDADAIFHAMLGHPSLSLVDHGALTKRRNVNGSVADRIPGPQPGLKTDAPYYTEAYHRLDPDASTALPILLHVIDPRSALAGRTLNILDQLWDARWSIGGYERYNSSSQQDQPGPWCFSTAFVARALQDAGLHEKSRRALRWLRGIQGGGAGAWYEEIPLTRSQIPTAGIVPWASAEVIEFAITDWLGLRFEGNNLVIQPNLFPEDHGCRADLRFRSSRLRISVHRAGNALRARVNGITLPPRKDGSFLVAATMLNADVEIAVTLPVAEAGRSAMGNGGPD
jgi:hypothetical protein